MTKKTNEAAVKMRSLILDSCVRGAVCSLAAANHDSSGTAAFVGKP